jgi:hypothetical protein
MFRSTWGGHINLGDLRPRLYFIKSPLEQTTGAINMRASREVEQLN